MAGGRSQESGFFTLYQEHHAWLVRWIARRTYSSDCAQDLAQDTFMKILDRSLAPESLLRPRAWLAKTAGNIAVDLARRQILERNYLELLANVPESEHPSPEERFEVLQLLEQIDSLLDGLRPVEKTAFLMSRLDGMPYRAIASELGVSLSSVEKYMAKAMLCCYASLFPEGTE